MHAMHTLQAMQAMDALHGMQGLPGMSAIPLMPAIPMPPAMAQPGPPMPLIAHGLPTPTYDNNTASYMGYNFAPPPPPMMPGGMRSPDDDYVPTEDYLEVTGAMDFTDPGEVQRIMSFCDDLGSTHGMF